MITTKWSSHKPSLFEIRNKHSSVDYESKGAGISIPKIGVELTLIGQRTRCYFHISPPGLDSLYYVVVGTTIYFSTYLLKLHKLSAGHKVEQVRDGILYLFDGKSLRKFKGQLLVIPKKNNHEPSVAADKLWSLLKEAASDILKLEGTDSKAIVCTSISGGTDGILTALALQAAGINQVCVCVGRTVEDFDPKNAKLYAAHFNLPYKFLPLPKETSELQSLLSRTLESIEQVDFSNVLMGMCNVLVRDFAESQGINIFFNADFADVILGNDILTVGMYKKNRKNAGLEVTQESWAEYRLTTVLHMLPTNIQIAKVFSQGTNKVHQLFTHPKVLDYLLACPLVSTPVSRDKILYKLILSKLSDTVAWSFKKKIGFYTGAGIGKIRLENSVLSDENIRTTFNDIKGTK